MLMQSQAHLRALLRDTSHKVVFHLLLSALEPSFSPSLSFPLRFLRLMAVLCRFLGTVPSGKVKRKALPL